MPKLEDAAADGSEGRIYMWAQYARAGLCVSGAFAFLLVGWAAAEHAITQRQSRDDIRACRVRFERALALREKLKYGVTVENWKGD